MNTKVAIIGGGAAGYFFAVNAAKINPAYEFTIYEQAKQGLQKVKISGGGRCNLTHYCFNAKKLATNYPRGQQELIKPFKKFGPKQTIEWFENRGVSTNREDDNRVFPTSNQSQSVIDCLLNDCKALGVKQVFSQKLKQIEPIDNGEDGFTLHFTNETIAVDKVLLATGSSKMVWKILEEIGYQIVPPVPSLFTFSINDARIKDLPGLTIANVIVSLKKSTLKTKGAVLITHKGLSGPGILKLSAYGAREFAERGYKTEIAINFSPSLSITKLKEIRDNDGSLMVEQTKFDCPKRLISALIKASGVDPKKKWASCSNKELEAVYQAFCEATFEVNGQNTFKQEFVTAGGVDLSQIDFTTFSSKRHKNLYFAGEVLNIDAITGGFNFQAAWTGAFLAAKSL